MPSGLPAAALLVSSLGLCGACGSAPAAAPRVVTPLDESTARQWIAEAVGAEGEVPTGQRAVKLPRNKQLLADIGVSGHKLAIAFVIESERRELGSSVPAHDVGSAALALVRDAEDPATRVLVLHDLGYTTDEQAGEERDVSSTVVKQRLQRDVRDFLAEARRRGWP
jgi:hypothetical protein